MNNFKSVFLRIRNNDYFEAFVISVIFISAVAVGFRTYEESFDPEIFLYLSYLDYFITFVFLTEIIIRMIAENPQGTVVIQADEKSTADTIIDVMDEVREAGVVDISIASEPNF